MKHTSLHNVHMNPFDRKYTPSQSNVPNLVSNAHSSPRIDAALAAYTEFLTNFELTYELYYSW